MADYFLALDFGGTKHAAGLLAAGAPAWLATQQAPAPPQSDRAKDMAVMLGLADAVLQKLPGRLRAVGVSFGGPVHWPTGRVILSHHVPGWEDTPLVQMLQDRFGVPAAMDNDANAAALGEWRYGAGRGSHSLFYVTVSTGIGGGWVLEARVWRGADSMAGEIGHLALDPAGPPCVCGKRGCVEAIGSGTGIARAMEARGPEAGRPPAGWTAQSVNLAAEQGNRAAVDVMERAAWALGTGIGIAVNLLNPEKVIIGGGVAAAGPVYWQKLRGTARAFGLPQLRVEMEPAGLGARSPLWGAAALAEQAANETVS